MMNGARTQRIVTPREIYTGEIISAIFNCEHNGVRKDSTRGERALDATTTARLNLRFYLSDVINN